MIDVRESAEFATAKSCREQKILEQKPATMSRYVASTLRRRLRRQYEGKSLLEKLPVVLSILWRLLCDLLALLEIRSYIWNIAESYVSTNQPIVKTITRSLIDCPPILEEDWEKLTSATARFPVGDGFVAEIVDGQLVVWGGAQEQKDGSHALLPKNVVYSFQIGRSLHDGRIQGFWTAMRAKGDIHPGSKYAASAVSDGTLYIIGGYTNGWNRNCTDVVSTLSAEGRFSKRSPSTALTTIPPRAEHKAFVYKDKIFFLGGFVPSEYATDSNDEYVECTINPGVRYTREFYRFDPATDEIEKMSSTSSPFTPRVGFAPAILGDRLFVLGGHCNGALNDFLSFDMVARQWTALTKIEFAKGIRYHTITPISPTQLLLVGGENDEGSTLSNRVRIFDADADKFAWKEEEPLERELVGAGGLTEHKAVRTKNETGVVVLCLGGFVDAPYTHSWTHPNHIAVFDVGYA